MKDTTLDGMVFKLLEQVNAQSKLDSKHVEDICLGNVREGSAAYYVRAAALAAGYPNTCAASASARFCSSGLTATQHIATSIQAGIIDCGIAIGAELLSDNRPRLERPFVDEIMGNSEARDCMIPMGELISTVILGDMLANISRQAAHRKLSPKNSTLPAKSKTNTQLSPTAEPKLPTKLGFSKTSSFPSP